MVIPVSVVIPAHDEERVIARVLTRLLEGAQSGELEIVVVCNGCTDDTAAIARATTPDAVVVELTEASKYRALNAGDVRATRFPRFYVDADVELDIHGVRATAGLLARGDALCAAPVPAFELADRPWYVRSFFRVFSRMPFMTDPGVVGTGVYALSERGRARFAAFPAITADDQFVLERFTATERVAVRSEHFVVHTPRDLPNLVRTRRRTYRGNIELRSHTAPIEPRVLPSNGRRLAALLRNPATAASVPVYLAVNLWARALATMTPAGAWERDVSTR